MNKALYAGIGILIIAAIGIAVVQMQPQASTGSEVAQQPSVIPSPSDTPVAPAPAATSTQPATTPASSGITASEVAQHNTTRLRAATPSSAPVSTTSHSGSISILVELARSSGFAGETVRHSLRDSMAGRLRPSPRWHRCVSLPSPIKSALWLRCILSSSRFPR